ncbi:hypothetical protein Egran_05096, partial [Elaphomyces granulatus]
MFRRNAENFSADTPPSETSGLPSELAVI